MFQDKFPITVLYVEDEDTIRAQTQKILFRLIENVIVAENGLIGIEKFNANKIDLVISDIKMPVLDGLAMSRRIREQQKHVPIIIMTAHSDAQKLMDAIEAGVNDFLVKPIDVDRLENLIKKYARETMLSKELKAQAERFQAMLDFQDNMIILTDGKHLLESNKRFADFVGDECLMRLKSGSLGIDEILVWDDKLQVKADQWVKYVLQGSLSHNTVRLKGKDLNEKIFLINVKKLEKNDGYFVVSLADITDYENEHKQLETLASTDPLTKVYNRLKFTSFLNTELERAQRYKQIFSVAMFDIDRFKLVNDTFGHDKGDDVLVGISDLAKHNIRSTDMLARWGGEEFMILFSNTQSSGALILCERLRKLIQECNWGGIGTVTCSFGITEYQEGELLKDMLKRADDALYEAKNSGRNRCIIK